MDDDLDRLAARYGIAPSYASEQGELRVIASEVKRALLAAMGVVAKDDASIRAAIEHAPGMADVGATASSTCYMPDWLRDGRCWGITCQLYGLQSARSQGIGDFEDLARFCEIAASVGADFVGTNPLHALFGADPDRTSPYSPSSRRFPQSDLHFALGHRRRNGAAL